MNSLGNRTFQGMGLKPDLARRLDDLARGLNALQQTLVQPAQVAAAVPAVSSSTTILSGPGGGGSSPSVGTGAVVGWEIMVPVSDAVTPLASVASAHEVVLNRPTTAINNISGATVGQRWDLIMTQDSTGGRLITWGGGYKGVAGWEISTVLSTRTVANFVVDPSGNSVLESFNTGMGI